MALDKLVDSTQLDADLTTIANAIRTKGGTSAQLSFPSGMAQAIADLPSGGSLPSSISKIDGGSFTYASTTSVTAQITHNLGVIPRGVIVWTEEADMGQYFYGGGFIRFNSTGISDGACRIIIYRSGGNIDRNFSVHASYSGMLTNTFWTIGHGSYSYQAGKTYKWIAWA